MRRHSRKFDILSRLVRSNHCPHTSDLTDRSTGEHNDPDILDNNTSLRHIDLTTEHADMTNMISGLKVFGNLRHLKALRAVSLHFHEKFDEDKRKWADLDELLAQARDTLDDVQIYAHTDENNRYLPPDLALLRGGLPSVAGNISLHEIDEEKADN
jgi:hypothetical protein